jgi:hypothetical protein
MTTMFVPSPTRPRAVRSSPLRRYFGVATRSQSYRNLCYLLLGLPLGTAWFTLLVTGVSVAFSMVVIALLGIPLLVGAWYVTRAFANVERAVANVLLGQHIAHAPMRTGVRGNLWVRLRSMTRQRDRWRELGYLMLRFPAGIATFVAAVTVLATPLLIAYAPFAARYEGDHPFGDWAMSSRMEDVASSAPWSWLLVPLGAVLLVGSLHVVNAVARACARWSTAWLGGAAVPARSA